MVRSAEMFMDFLNTRDKVLERSECVIQVGHARTIRAIITSMKAICEIADSNEEFVSRIADRIAGYYGMRSYAADDKLDVDNLLLEVLFLRPAEEALDTIAEACRLKYDYSGNYKKQLEEVAGLGDFMYPDKHK